jgi:hypothetical protein
VSKTIDADSIGENAIDFEQRIGVLEIFEAAFKNKPTRSNRQKMTQLIGNLLGVETL